MNNRSAHVLDVADVMDLASFLFAGMDPGFDCAATFDINNDGAYGVVDLVALAQGVFRSSVFTIPPPNSENPGPGIPGVVQLDGGRIRSALGCAQGESCP